jgi:hypothetical protein
MISKSNGCRGTLFSDKPILYIYIPIHFGGEISISNAIYSADSTSDKTGGFLQENIRALSHQRCEAWLNIITQMAKYGMIRTVIGEVLDALLRKPTSKG